MQKPSEMKVFAFKKEDKKYRADALRIVRHI